MWPSPGTVQPAPLLQTQAQQGRAAKHGRVSGPLQTTDTKLLRGAINREAVRLCVQAGRHAAMGPSRQAGRNGF